MPQVDWYFDFISPYAWLQAETLARLPQDVVLACKPVLFAGLLEHWGQLGPAEIPPKRTFTYRYVVWRAHQLGFPACPPRSHPFNPLPLLRLAIVLGCERQKMLRLFRFVWSEGKLPDDAPAWRALIEELGVPDADVVHTGFYRPNLTLDVIRTDGDREKRRLLRKVLANCEGTGIIYAATVKAVEELAEKKVAGEEIVATVSPEPTKVVDLLDALKASVEATKSKQKTAQAG